MTDSPSGVTDTSRPVGSSPVARVAAARACGSSVAAPPPSVSTTSVNEPVDRCPKCSWRICSARWESVPGSVKRFVSRSESLDDAAPATTNATIHVPAPHGRHRSHGGEPDVHDAGHGYEEREQDAFRPAHR
jgi:hypothetical protein